MFYFILFFQKAQFRNWTYFFASIFNEEMKKHQKSDKKRKKKRKLAIKCLIFMSFHNYFKNIEYFCGFWQFFAKYGFFYGFWHFLEKSECFEIKKYENCDLFSKKLYNLCIFFKFLSFFWKKFGILRFFKKKTQKK